RDHHQTQSAEHRENRHCRQDDEQAPLGEIGDDLARGRTRRGQGGEEEQTREQPASDPEDAAQHVDQPQQQQLTLHWSHPEGVERIPAMALRSYIPPQDRAIRIRTVAVCTAIMVACMRREANTDAQPLARVPSDTSERVVVTTVGAEHACALSSRSLAWCWGDLDGSPPGTEAAVAGAVRIGGDHRFRSIAAGGSFTCGIDTDGL